MVDTTEECYSLGKTDEDGNVSLSFSAQTSGALAVTVSGQNLIPYEGKVELVNSDVAVGFNSYTIDHDTLGYSYGNSDSLANPGEILELAVTLRNFGNNLTANNVQGAIEPIDNSMAEILDGSRNFGNILPGQNGASAQPFVVRINPNAADGDLVWLQVTATDQDTHSWHSVIEIPVTAPQFTIRSAAILDANGRLDPGDTAQMVVTIINHGRDAAGVVGTISTMDDFARVRSAEGTFGDMPMGDTSSNALSPMVVSVDLGRISRQENKV